MCQSHISCVSDSPLPCVCVSVPYPVFDDQSHTSGVCQSHTARVSLVCPLVQFLLCVCQSLFSCIYIAILYSAVSSNNRRESSLEHVSTLIFKMILNRFFDLTRHTRFSTDKTQHFEICILQRLTSIFFCPNRSRFLNQAIAYAGSDVFTASKGDDQNAPNMVVLITNGRSADPVTGVRWTF